MHTPKGSGPVPFGMRHVIALVLSCVTSLAIAQGSTGGGFPADWCYRYTFDAGETWGSTRAAACTSALGMFQRSFPAYNFTSTVLEADGRCAAVNQWDERIRATAGSEVGPEFCPQPPSPCEAKTGQTTMVNYTIAWSRISGHSQSQTGDLSDIVGGVTAPPATGCDGTCTITNQAYGNLWHATSPSATGLYRISQDVIGTFTGAACTAKTSGTDPSAAPKPCDGYMGSVNGKTVCVAPIGSSPTNVPKPPSSPPPLTGNPAAGSSPSDSPATRNPPTGNGGPSGGPASSTDGRNTGGGTAPGASPTGGGGAGETTPPKDPCGLPGTPACKIDETGTPNGSGITGAAGAAKTAGDALPGAVSGVDKPSSLGWSFGVTLPDGACTALQFYKPGGTWQVDPCSNAHVALFRTLLAWMMGVLTALYVWRSATAAVSGE